MLNKVILQGRLVAAPELRRTQSGAAVAAFRIACDRDYAGKDGRREADFLPCVAWRHSAEFVSRYFGKGDMILLEGRLQVREYTDRDGVRRYVTEVMVSQVNFCGGRNSGGSSVESSGYSSSRNGAEPVTMPQEFEELADDEGELPF